MPKFVHNHVDQIFRGVITKDLDISVGGYPGKRTQSFVGCLGFYIILHDNSVIIVINLLVYLLSYGVNAGDRS